MYKHLRVRQPAELRRHRAAQPRAGEVERLELAPLAHLRRQRAAQLGVAHDEVLLEVDQPADGPRQRAAHGHAGPP